MNLDEARITNFRCIHDSGAFSLRQLTCLVGKNESGKSSVLHALAKLNSADPALANFDKERDYPRHILTDFDEKQQVLHTTWSLNDDDVAAVEQALGPGCLSSRSVEVVLTCDNRRRWSVPLDEKKLAGGRSNADPVEAVSRVLDSRMPKLLYFASYDRMSGSVSLEHLRQAVAQHTVSKSDSVFLAYLDFMGITLDELAALTRYEAMKARVEAASIKISRRILKYWSQNHHLKVQFSLEAGRPGDAAPFDAGTIMRTRILNGLHDMTVPFDDQSAGFVWFFSFLILFSQVLKHHGNVIILLDEPGLNLHPKAQADLLRFMNEELKPHHQVIYTTHSPFMIPADDLASVRTVEDVVKYAPDGAVREVLGTSVGDQVLSADTDTLFPLQAALGYELTHSLFVGQHTLVVEGPSDILYLQAASAELGRRRRTRLDPRWTLCPAGGANNVAAFFRLFGGNRAHLAILVNSAPGNAGRTKSLRESHLLEDGRIFATREFCAQTEADVEDFFGLDLFVDLVNSAYALTGVSKLTVGSVPAAAEESPRLVKRTAAALGSVPSLPDFNRYIPALWLLQNPVWLGRSDPVRGAALDRFEALFTKLNALL